MCKADCGSRTLNDPLPACVYDCDSDSCDNDPLVVEDVSDDWRNCCNRAVAAEAAAVFLCSHTLTSTQITEGNGQGFRDLSLSNAGAVIKAA